MHIYVLRILMLGTVLFGSTYFFMVMFQCRPIMTFWDDNPRAPGKCWNDRVVLIMTYTAAAINCLADWAFGILPIFIVWSLNLPFKSKMLVMLILGFAAIGSTATIVRIFYCKYKISNWRQLIISHGQSSKIPSSLAIGQETLCCVPVANSHGTKCITSSMAKIFCGRQLTSQSGAPSSLELELRRLRLQHYGLSGNSFATGPVSPQRPRPISAGVNGTAERGLTFGQKVPDQNARLAFGRTSTRA